MHKIPSEGFYRILSFSDFTKAYWNRLRGSNKNYPKSSISRMAALLPTSVYKRNQVIPL